jgi:hypothetical protein
MLRAKRQRIILSMGQILKKMTAFHHDGAALWRATRHRTSQNRHAQKWPLQAACGLPRHLQSGTLTA